MAQVVALGLDGPERGPAQAVQLQGHPLPLGTQHLRVNRAWCSAVQGTISFTRQPCCLTMCIHACAQFGCGMPALGLMSGCRI